MTALNNPLKGDIFTRLGQPNSGLKVTANAQPTLGVSVTEGSFWANGTTLVEFYGSTLDLTGSIPSSNARWVLVALTSAGTLKSVNGTASTAPEQPTVLNTDLPLALIYIESTDTVITDDKIFDVRPHVRNGFNSISHDNILNLSAANSHPISAITGLQAALDAKSDVATHNDDIATKADVDGTTSDVFTLNKDFSGTPGAEVRLIVNRGSSTDVEIRWNESLDRWEFTNDGATYVPLSTGIPAAGPLNIKSVTTPYTVLVADLENILVFDDAAACVLNVPDGLGTGFNVTFRNKQGGAVTVTPTGTSVVVGAGTVTSDSTKANSLYVEDATTIVTVGDFA